MLNSQSLIYGALGWLAGFYLLPVVAEKVGFGALALKQNGRHMGALAYKKNRRNPRYGAVHRMGMHPMGAIHMNPGHMGAIHMNPGHMGAIQMGAIHTNPIHL